MCSKELLLIACLFLLGGLRLTSTTTTTTFVAAMSIANQDLDRYFRSANATQILATEDRILIDFYNYAFLNYTYQNEDGELQRVTFTEEKARYGEGKVMDRLGLLVHISDVDNVRNDTACTPNILGTNGNDLPAAGVPWIALVKRGHCTFEQKVKHVYGHGACGVIIYNDKPVNNLEKMQIKDQSRNITAVITYLDIGLEIARIVDQGWHMEIAIIAGRSGSRPINTLNKTSVLFVSISFIVLMVISLVWLLFYYIQRFRYLQTKDQQSRQLCSVTKKAIMKIPTKTGKSSDEKDMDSDCCAICIEAYKPSDCIRVLPCKHEFHKNCIDPWLIEHRTCPMCKLDVLKFYGFVVGDQIHPTPSPQYVPPNIATLQGAGVGAGGIGGGGTIAGQSGDNDVEVIVVALAPPYSAAQPSSSSSSSSPAHNTQASAMQQVAHAQTTTHTQLPNRAPATATASTAVGSAAAAHAHSQSHTHTTNCSCTNANGSDSSQQHSCQHTRFGGSSNNNNNSNNNSNSATSAESSYIMRRNSAPLVLQVSTASHQVTDV